MKPWAIGAAALAAAIGCSGPPPAARFEAKGLGEPPGAPPALLRCAPQLGFASVVAGLSVQRTLACSVEGASLRWSLGAIEVQAPFRLGATRGAGGSVLELDLVYQPLVEGTHQRLLTIVYVREGGAEVKVTVALRGEASGWDEPPPRAPCRADAPAPLLDQVLARAGLDRQTFGFSAEDLAQSSYSVGGYLDDPFVLSWFKATRADPARIGCFEHEVAGALDHLLGGRHPVAGMIRHAARLLDRQSEGPPYPPVPDVATFEQAIAVLCQGPAAPCSGERGAVPSALGRALAPVLRAVHEALQARRRVDSVSVGRSSSFWQLHGGNLLLPFGSSSPDPAGPDRAYLVGAARAELYTAAAQLAFAIEATDWSPFVGQVGVSYELKTAAGVVRISDGAPHTHADDGQAVLLELDLGGDDLYLGPVASNVSGANAVSVAIDLAGDDRYTYAAMQTPFDRPGLPPADAAGRYAGNAMYGPLSPSNVSRQGAARNGIALLFDLGAGNDRYESLRASQGYAHLGVGVLFDQGGDDVYVAEAAAQGAAQFGIALAIDAGKGRDTRSAFTYAQGFGYVGGAGFLVDGGGDDAYRCDHGDPARGGIRLYYTPQLPSSGNSSFCQGAGFGMRGSSLATHLSGGLGVLRDRAGNDSYEASVFGQGTGYWQGTGVLSDGEGDDAYDAYYYAQGGAAHYAIGVLADSGGNDRFNLIRAANYMHLGAGHDFSLGALLNEGGDDEYRISGLAAGASNCNGVGLFVDGAGDDQYVSTSDYGSGMGNVSGECIGTRPKAKSVGIMIDASGADSYLYPQSDFPIPFDSSEWGHARAGLASEHGGGVDGEGEAGIRADSPSVGRW